MSDGRVFLGIAVFLAAGLAVPVILPAIPLLLAAITSLLFIITLARLFLRD